MIYTALALALAPGVAISLFIIRRDKHNREPNKLLFISFLLGMLSTVPTVVIGEMISGITGWATGIDTLTTFWYAFVNVSMVEEFCKLFFVMIFAFPKKEFDEPFDGITYSVMVAMGFATLENVLYVVDGGLSVAIARMLTAVPAHATFGVLMGYFLGMYKFKQEKLGLLFLAILVPMIFHGFYDFFLMVDNQSGMFLGALVSLVVSIVLSFRAIRLHQKNSPFHPSLASLETPVEKRGDDAIPGGKPGSTP